MPEAGAKGELCQQSRGVSKKSIMIRLAQAAGISARNSSCGLNRFPGVQPVAELAVLVIKSDLKSI